MPACSKTDPLLAKAKPIRDGGSDPGTAYVRRDEPLRAIAARERSENMRKKKL